MTMTRTSSLAGGLTIALLATNVLWADYAYSQRSTLVHLEQAAGDATLLLDQALAVLPVAADEDASQEEVIAAAQRTGAAMAPVEKGGYIWVRGLGMRFSDEGRLVSVSTNEQDATQGPDAEDFGLSSGVVASSPRADSDAI